MSFDAACLLVRFQDFAPSLGVSQWQTSSSVTPPLTVEDCFSLSVKSLRFLLRPCLCVPPINATLVSFFHRTTSLHQDEHNRLRTKHSYSPSCNPPPTLHPPTSQQPSAPKAFHTNTQETTPTRNMQLQRFKAILRVTAMRHQRTTPVCQTPCPNQKAENARSRSSMSCPRELPATPSRRRRRLSRSTSGSSTARAR